MAHRIQSPCLMKILFLRCGSNPISIGVQSTERGMKMSSITERRSLRWFAFFILSVIFLALFMGSPAFATDYYWIGGSGDWSDPSNWNPTGPPQGGTSKQAECISDAVRLRQ